MPNLVTNENLVLLAFLIHFMVFGYGNCGEWTFKDRPSKLKKHKEFYHKKVNFWIKIQIAVRKYSIILVFIFENH